jgi:hypothetical protein
MKKCLATGAFLVLALAACSVLAEDSSLKSGLQVGESPTPFNPLHCNGKRAGSKTCLV